ncbi:DegT/DnrJ/EryC1/StrS aminotransferase family protein [bacterium AH-315-E10]|nr:DegT/DnrJ/EryC1/StrS aminotransferase family protein [bacterium AH-315-E10]
MLEIGKKESDAVAKVLSSGKIFRYTKDGTCAQFEERYAKFLGSTNVTLCASGSTAISITLNALGIGPGDEVLIPAHTYMATATAVVDAGAIPVIVDIDESIMISPAAIEKAIRRRTKAIIPVHMWGHVCDMPAIMKIARKHKLLVIEDCCQCVGGAHLKKMVGTFGDAGCYSFNFFKNMTCGEGGAVVLKNKKHLNTLRNLVDCCGFFWTGRAQAGQAFCAGSARLADTEGAILNSQLDRLPGMIKKCQSIQKRILKGTAKSGLTPIPMHSPNNECCTQVAFQLPTVDAATDFSARTGSGILINTGRHTFTEWDPILNKNGHAHPLMDPFKMKANEKCRMNYSKDMLPNTLDILKRTVAFGISPTMTAASVTALIKRINEAMK